MEMVLRTIYLSLVVGSFFFFYRSLKKCLRGISSWSYNKTDCSDLSVEYELHDGAASNVQVYYNYTVENRVYSGNRISYGVHTQHNLQEFSQPKKPREVFYSPSNPHRSVLVRGVALSSAAGIMVFGSIFLLLTSILIFDYYQELIGIFELDSGIGGSV